MKSVTRTVTAALLAPLFGMGLLTLPPHTAAYAGYRCPQGYIVANPTQCAAAPEGGDKVLAASASR